MAGIIGADGKALTPQEDAPLDLTKTNPIECKGCGGEVFVQGFSFRKTSKLLTGGTEDEVIPIEVFLCGDCGELLNELLPKGLKIEE
jgi:DNA-directed RNA polymerase subunit RPC12/RpoP